MSKGFTLIEIIIVICIILLLLVIVWPVGANFYRQEMLTKTQQQVIWVLKQARNNAVNQKYNTSYGVKFQPGEIILFQGNSFNDRNQLQDIYYPLSSVISLNGLQEIVFAANTGFVVNAGSIILRTNNLVKEIKINQLGVIDY